MFTHPTHHPMIPRKSLPSPDSSSSGDSDSEITQELERKRRQIEEDVSSFRAQKEKEFRDFERELRSTSGQRSPGSSSSQAGKSKQRDVVEKPPSGSSSSSALDLLVGHGTSQKPQTFNMTRRRPPESTQHMTNPAKTGPSLSKPVVSLDKMNIKGQTTSPHTGRPRTPPTPTLLSRTLTRSSSSSSLAISPPLPKNKAPPVKIPATPSEAPPPSDRHREPLTGLFTPSYLALLDSSINRPYQSSSALVTPPCEDEAATAPSSYKSGIVNDILPLTSSSFPPHVTISPGGHTHASKRSYTAPTVSRNRMPSALRTVSGGAIGRKPKHVTFRLADSVIVEPSSSYEEGPSPQSEGEDERSKKSRSGMRSPVRTGKSLLSRTLSSDEEDAEAGVQPGMNMGDVIQRLNHYNNIESTKEDGEEDLEIEDDDDDNDDEEDQDLPMEMSNLRYDEEDSSDRNFTVNYHEQDETSEIDDGYFSPKNKHVSTTNGISNSHSPLVPYREDDWNQLSSSDKDRLLFEARRHSNDSDEQDMRHSKPIAPPQTNNGGFSGGLRQNIDGGSGVGFFELDEELASPDAGKVQPFEFDTDLDLDDSAVGNIDETIGASGKPIMDESRGKQRSDDPPLKFGVGSVPINIVRPSTSVSSSWVGTFGH